MFTESLMISGLLKPLPVKDYSRTKSKIEKPFLHVLTLIIHTYLQ
jgi:hypothetical protein